MSTSTGQPATPLLDDDTAINIALFAALRSGMPTDELEELCRRAAESMHGVPFLTEVARRIMPPRPAPVLTVLACRRAHRAMFGWRSVTDEQSFDGRCVGCSAKTGRWHWPRCGEAFAVLPRDDQAALVWWMRKTEV